MILDLRLDAGGGDPSPKSNPINILNKIMSEKYLINVWNVDTQKSQIHLAKEPPLLQRRLEYFFLSSTLQENIHKTDKLLRASKVIIARFLSR